MLDLTKVAAQVSIAVSQFRDGLAEHATRLKQAHTLVAKGDADFEKLRHKIEASSKKTAWLIADPAEPLGTRYPTPNIPPNYTVIATDGSNIDVDRHQSARCCLINIGQARLDYGDDYNAELTSVPRLYADKSEMSLSNGLHEQAIEGTLLGIKRTVEELEHLAKVSAKVPPEKPTLALVDGSLIMWGLTNEGYPDFVSHELLENGYLKAMNKLYDLAKRSRIVLASYISFPRSANAVNSLRLVLCPEAIADCGKHCKGLTNKERPCESMSGVQDSDIFNELLAIGERSAIFRSQSKITERYGPHRVYFFYLKLAEEIARIEIPEWVALDKDRLNLTHALINDQCQRGDGYPVALAEAHEQAVITGADRANFQQVWESWLISERLPQATSAKSQSKRTRWV